MHYFVSFLFCNHLDGEERTSRFTLIIFLMSCDMLCIPLCLSCFAIILMVKREPVVFPVSCDMLCITLCLSYFAIILMVKRDRLFYLDYLPDVL